MWSRPTLTAVGGIQRESKRSQLAAGMRGHRGVRRGDQVTVDLNEN